MSGYVFPFIFIQQVIYKRSASLIITMPQKKIQYKGFDFEKYPHVNGQWNKITAEYMTPFPYNDRDFFEFYIWYRGTKLRYISMISELKFSIQNNLYYRRYDIIHNTDTFYYHPCLQWSENNSSFLKRFALFLCWTELKKKLWLSTIAPRMTRKAPLKLSSQSTVKKISGCIIRK